MENDGTFLPLALLSSAGDLRRMLLFHTEESVLEYRVDDDQATCDVSFLPLLGRVVIKCGVGLCVTSD